MVNHMAPGDTWRKLKELVPPVLYIVGADSPVSTPLSNQRKMENTPIAEMITVPGAGHLVNLEKPKETGRRPDPKQLRRVLTNAKL